MRADARTSGGVRATTGFPKNPSAGFSLDDSEFPQVDAYCVLSAVDLDRERTRVLHQGEGAPLHRRIAKPTLRFGPRVSRLSPVAFGQSNFQFIDTDLAIPRDKRAGG